MADLRLGLDLPDGIPPWLAAFVLEAQRETDTLRENGAEQAAAARLALLKKLPAAAAAKVNQAGVCAFTRHAQAARSCGRCLSMERRTGRASSIATRRKRSAKGTSWFEHCWQTKKRSMNKASRWGWWQSCTSRARRLRLRSHVPGKPTPARSS